MIVNIRKWAIIVLVLLCSPTFAQPLSSVGQILPNHVPREVALGLALKTSHVNSNQMLNLRVIVPSKDRAGLDNFVKELYDPKDPNYHKFLTPDQFDLMFGASTVDSAEVTQYLQAQGFRVVNKSKNGFILTVQGSVSNVEHAFSVNINNYRDTKGSAFFAPDANPTIPLQIAGKISSIIGLDNVRRFHSHFYKSHRLPMKNISGVKLKPSQAPILVHKLSTTIASNYLVSKVGLANLNVKPRSGSAPLAPTYLTAVASDYQVILYWAPSIGATSYNIYRSTDNQNYSQLVSLVTTTNYADDYSQDTNLPYNGQIVYYEVTAVNSNGESSDSTVASATPFGFLGYQGSVGPTDIADAYNLNSVSSTGGNQTLGLFELDGYLANDITGFENNYNLSAVPLTNTLVDGATGAQCASGETSEQCGTDEVTLDIELAIAAAPGLNNIIVYEAPNSDLAPTGWADLWNKIAEDDLAKVISCSWGSEESGAYPVSDIFEQLASQGQTVLAAAGDSGAYDNCDAGTVPPNCTVNNVSATGVLSVDDPASDPYVTGVGISILNVNNPGASNETYQSEEASLIGGGGISSYVTMPSYQLAAATSYYNATSGSFGSKTFRNVPDVALNGDPATAYGIFVTDPVDGQTWEGIAGSSTAAPIWAAFIARVNQGRALEGLSSLGELNPIIYQIAQSSDYSTVFNNNITSGINNQYPNFAGNDYYPAQAGYNVITGLGSFNGANLYSEMLGPAAPTGVSAEISNNQITLNWTASSTSNVASYNIKRSTASTGPFSTLSNGSAVTGTSFTDTTASNGSTYYYEISAINAGGVEGPNSTPAVSATLSGEVPTAPTTVTATAGNAQATISFSGASGNGSTITSYTVTSSPGSFTASGSSSPLTVTGLTNGTSYTFTVTATNGVGTSTASAASNSVTPTDGPDLTVTSTAGLLGNTVSVTVKGDFTVAVNSVQFTLSFDQNLLTIASIVGPNSWTTVSNINTPGQVVVGMFNTGGATTEFTGQGVFVATINFTVNNPPGSSATSSALTLSATTFDSTSISTFNNGTFTLLTTAIAPTAPTIVTAAAGNTQATVTFSGASADGSAITGYTVTSAPGSFTATGTTSPIIVTGLTNGTTYTFTVKATNSVGTSSASVPSNSVTPAGVPIAPTTVTAAAGNAQATVTFSGASNNGSAITSYTVTSLPGSFTATGTTSPITVTGLTNATAYTFTVTATNSVGTSSASAASNSVTPGTLPTAPTTVTATAGDTQATVNFSGASGNGNAITGYTVTSLPGSFTATGTTSPIIVTGLTNGTTYSFTVTATSSVGTSSASAASNSVTPGSPPTAPTTVTATAGDTQATVNFSGASGNGNAITGYTVTSLPGSFTATGTASPIIVTGLTNGTAYTFTVTATNEIGTSTASTASNSVTPAGLPTAPTTVTAAAGNTQATVTFSGASSNGSAITGYTVTSSPGSFTATGSTSPIIVTGLTNGTAYSFTVTATNGVGTSSASAASNSVTPEGNLPTAPTTVTATAGDTQATVNFSGASGNGNAITGYTVTSSPGSFTATGTASPIIVTGLTNGTAYTFTVTATNSVGTSSASAASNSVTPAGLPIAPTTVTAQAGNGQATITFSGESGNGSAITSYTVTSSPGSFSGTGSASPITVLGLSNGTQYTFTVTATNGIGSATSNPSNPVTPVAGLPTPPTTVTAQAGNGQATISFSGASGNGSAITSYTVTSSPGSFTGTGSASPITVSGLTNGTQYTFTVTATNGIGSATSNPSNPITPSIMAPPTALNGSILGGRISGQIVYLGTYLTWTQSTDPAVSQNKIYRSMASGPFTLLATINAATSYKDTSTSSGVVYTYQVTALKSGNVESSASNQVSLHY